MKQILVYLYLIILFLIPHIRWISPFYSQQWVYGMPVYLGILFCFMFPLLFKSLPKWRLFCHFSVVAILGYIIFSHDFDTKYAIPSSLTIFLLIGMPIVGLGAPMVLASMEDPVFARRVLIVLSVSCVLQTVFMTIESNHPDLLFLVRPNTEGTGGEWVYSNRFGSNRSMYTLTDPMSAGAWAWFTGIALIVLSPLVQAKAWQRAVYVTIGTLSLCSIVLTLSRGPAIVALISILTLVPFVLHTTRRRFLALLAVVGTVCIIGLSIYVVYIFDRPLFDSVQELQSVAFMRDEDGNAERLDVWSEGKKTFDNLQWTGAGLYTISFLWDQPDVNLEDTYLTIMYATGVPGLIYSVILISAWVVQSYRLALRLYFTKDRSPQRLLCLSWAVAWLPFTFIFPCFRNFECGFITCSILGSLLFFDRLRDRVVEDPAPFPMRRHLSVT
jgi:hypothetical protein